jgi:hypothetical protein
MTNRHLTTIQYLHCPSTSTVTQITATSNAAQKHPPPSSSKKTPTNPIPRSSTSFTRREESWRNYPTHRGDTTPYGDRMRTILSKCWRSCSRIPELIPARAIDKPGMRCGDAPSADIKRGERVLASVNGNSDRGRRSVESVGREVETMLLPMGQKHSLQIYVMWWVRKIPGRSRWNDVNSIVLSVLGRAEVKLSFLRRCRWISPLWNVTNVRRRIRVIAIGCIPYLNGEEKGYGKKLIYILAWTHPASLKI